MKNRVLCIIAFVCSLPLSAMPPHAPTMTPHSCIIGTLPARPKNLQDYTIETCAILLQFPDNVADTVAHTPARYDSMLYSTGVYYGQYRAGSLNDFYLENSYGSCDVHGGIAANHWYMSSKPYSYYDDNYYMLSTGYELAYDAVTLVDGDVDFSQFDTNNDNHIDGVFIVHAGPGGEDTGDPHQCWSHAITPFDYVTNDGIVIDGATNVPEINLVTPALDTTLCCIAVMCHELGHIVGLPDLYDYSRDTWGIGYWGLMGYGAWGAGGNTPWSPSHADAWCKMQVNWLTPTPIVTNTYGLKIVDSETNPVAYRVWRNGIVNDTFFLLENRQNKGFDAPLPGSGLLIWHIDPRYDYFDNVVDLEEADGCDDLDHGWGYRPDPHYYYHELGDAGDPFPGDSASTSFDSLSYPSSHDNWGNPTQIVVRNIAMLDDTVICDVLITPVAIGEQQYAEHAVMTVNPNPFRQRVELTIHNSTAAEAIIYDIAGRRVISLQGRAMNGACMFSWNGRDAHGMPVSAGVYWCVVSDDAVSPTKIVLLRD